MACRSCVRTPTVLMTGAEQRRLRADLPDQPFTPVRLFGGQGPVIDPPKGHEAPLICAVCGAVYYPVIRVPSMPMAPVEG